MGTIGRWIDERCAAEPDVMRRVLNRKFGDLDDFVGHDNKCGCLVGSWLIESNRLKEFDEWEYREGTMLACAENVGYQVAALAGHFEDDAGLDRKAADKHTIRLLKQRIRKSLGIAPENRPVQHLESVSR